MCETCKQPFVSRPCKKSIFCCRKCKLDSPRIRARLSESAKARKGGDGPFSSKAASIRLLTKKQMHTPEAREAAARARRARGNWRPPVQGGNGRPMPKPQQMLLEALGPDWVSEKRFPWGRSAIPAYLADMAHEECKLVVEVDGENHSSVRARDERKDRFLEERGWLVLRVSNDEVLEHLDRVLVSITSALTDRRRTYSAAGR